MAANPPGVRHVLMTADTVGGVWTYAVDLARELRRRGVRTTLAAMGGRLRPDQRAATEVIPDLRVEERPYRLEWMDEPWEEVALAGEWLLDLEGRERPDVVHLNAYVHGSLPWRAPCIVVAHSCVVSWWSAVFGDAPPESYDRYRAEVSRGIRAADALVAPTRAMLDVLLASYGLSRRGDVIPNGADAARFAPLEKEPYVLTAGRLWDRAKNLATLDAAAARLEWPVYAAGSETGPSGDSLEPLARVKTLGALPPEALRHWMARAALYASPAKYEPFGLSALEAALSGCALVLGDIPSLREIWQDAAIYVGPEDVDGLVSAIQRLSKDATFRLRMAAAARERGQHFPISDTAARYLRLYRSLVADPLHPAASPCE
jgi:glycosyltransferase involved in cell wall biosynthesis